MRRQDRRDIAIVVGCLGFCLLVIFALRGDLRFDGGGNAAEWVGGVATAAAVAGSVWGVTETNRREAERAWEAKLGKVYAWASIDDPSYDFFTIKIHNTSSQPIFEPRATVSGLGLVPRELTIELASYSLIPHAVWSYMSFVDDLSHKRTYR